MRKDFHGSLSLLSEMKKKLKAKAKGNILKQNKTIQ